MTDNPPGAAAPDPDDSAPVEPAMLSVVGEASPVEVAALVAALAAVSEPEGRAPSRKISSWADPARGLRQTLPSGVAAWRRSGLPG